MMRTVDRRVDVGEVVALGDIKSIAVEQPRGGGLNLRAVYSGEPTDFVLLNTHFEDDEELELPDGASVFHIADGTGMASPIVYYLVPKRVYGAAP